MAEIRCPNCGKENPDFLDFCQFCQTPLPQDLIHIGEEPTKKDTGELEQILPDWLKEVRQQGLEEAEDEALRPPSKPKVTEEPPDLLAGLMSQAESEEEELPDWLAGISPSLKKEETPPSPPPKKEEPSSFFAQFREAETQPPAKPQPPEEETPWGGLVEPVGRELTDWFGQEEPSAPPFREETGAPAGEDWMKDLSAFTAESAPAQEPEDLSWLRDLEAASKATEEPAAPKPEAAFPPSASEEDLDWLTKLGAASAPAFEEPAPAQPSGEEDLSWLDKLGGVTAPEEPAPAQPSAEEDLSWLDKLGGVTAPEEPAPVQPSAEEDLSWLKNLSAAKEPPTEPIPSQPAPVEEDLDWLKNLGISAAPPSQPAAPAFADTGELQPKEPPASAKPFQTAPLNELLGDEALRDTTPDWLKEALEEPSMPLPGATSLDWFAEQAKPPKETPPPAPFDQTPGKPAASTPAFDFSSGDSSAQDLDALFDVEMPDWLKGEPEKPETPQPGPVSTQPFTEEGEALAPVELPSWVQAMRPVDSAISGTAASVDMVTEREGPLAGFRGVIPLVPVGSALRPKAFSLKLQAGEEQQAAAALLEQMIASETAALPSKPAAVISSQRALRWALSALFLLVLTAVLWLGLQTMPIHPSSRLSDLIASLPDASPVLLVVDYEPAFAGELEASAGPLLDQLALSKHAIFDFVATSPNGAGLVERLMLHTNLSKPFPAGLGYRAGEQYFNLGFLPGGAAGAAGFVGDPQKLSRYAAILLLTDNVETSRTWIEQLEAAGPEIAGKPLIVVSSAQAAPMLQPYAASGQANLLVNGLYDAAKYEALNVSRPGLARAYWDALGFGLMMAVLAIVIGGAWNFYLRFREKHAETE
ncbi:MAG: hypothetical protein AB1509_14945 [Chloroflexota bacterium]